MIHSINLSLYPRLVKAVKEIAYDNGCVNCMITEQDVIENAFDALAAEFDPSELNRVETFLDALNDNELNQLCCGGDDGMRGKGSELEELVEHVLNHAFENLL